MLNTKMLLHCITTFIQTRCSHIASKNCGIWFSPKVWILWTDYSWSMFTGSSFLSSKWLLCKIFKKWNISIKYIYRPDQIYLSRPTKINGITLVLHVNCSLGCRWLVYTWPCANCEKNCHHLLINRALIFRNWLCTYPVTCNYTFCCSLTQSCWLETTYSAFNEVCLISILGVLCFKDNYYWKYFAVMV